jgi:hypothetical protein
VNNDMNYDGEFLENKNKMREPKKKVKMGSQ